MASAATVLTLLAVGMGISGFLAVRAHRVSQAIAGADAAAIAAAKDCVAATQPADVTALPGAQRKLDECATGAFQTQAAWYSAVLTEAYQAQHIRVRLPELYGAVERTEADGSVIALVVFQATISQDGVADRENSYRIRVRMVREDGHFKVAQLDQVTK
ncbi:Mce protein [Mycobacterium paragordonae]|jgi:Mce-associated membrane protein|uniref:Mce protein n=1 Tax=Mycobacterium paragordonae TaxID=1389713 RepID=UPI0012E2E13F|nr:Mce protein [Mycobacterium paragordonae]